MIISDPMNPTAAKLMMAEIKELTDKPVKYVIYSHNHWDHISEVGIFKAQGAKIVQHVCDSSGQILHIFARLGDGQVDSTHSL